MDTVQSAEILRLHATVRDLLALSIIPETWVGREPSAIAADLADLLIGSLELDFAFVRLCDPTGPQVAGMTRGEFLESISGMATTTPRRVWPNFSEGDRDER